MTELEYFKLYKQALRAPSIEFCRPEALDPVKLVKKAKKEASQREADEVFVVVDVDNYPVSQFQDAMDLCSRAKTPFHLVVSNPSFDVWLWWHIKAGSQSPLLVEDLQRDLLQAQILKGDPPKHLGDAYDPDQEQVARGRAVVSSLNELGSNPSTSVPKLLDRMQVLAKGNPYR